MSADIDPREETQPTDWRMQCAKCGRFLAGHQWGTIYAPWGDRLQYDGYVDRCNCPKCGWQDVRATPTRWVVLT